MPEPVDLASALAAVRADIPIHVDPRPDPCPRCGGRGSTDPFPCRCTPPPAIPDPADATHCPICHASTMFDGRCYGPPHEENR